MSKKFFKVVIATSFITFYFENEMLTSVNYSTSEKRITVNVVQGKFVVVKRSDENFINEIKEILNRVFKYNRVGFNELCKFTKEMKDDEFNEILNATGK